MKKQNQIKVIAASLAVTVSVQAWAALGSLQVQSSLGEPFAGSITVTGEEAKILLNNGQPTVSGAPLRATVVRQGDQAVIRLRSNQVVNEPLLSFGVTVGAQGRQYTALIDPPQYRSSAAVPADNTSRRQSAREAVRASVEDGSVPPARRNQAERTHRANAAAPVFAGQRYTVQPQENLVDVARKVQPQGLTLAQTMRALVRANPKSFRNGNPDLMYKGTTLRIPTASEMRQLARSTPPVSRAQTAAPVRTPSAPVTDSATTTPAPSQPAQVAVTPPVPASAPTPAPASAALPEVPVVASTPEMAASVPASAPVAVPVSAPVAPPAPQPAPAPAPVEQPADEGWMSLLSGGMLPYALGGAGLLLLLGLLLARRRKQGAAEADAMPTAPAAAPAAAVVAADVADDDDVVFDDVYVEPAEPVAQTPAAAKPAAAVAAGTAAAATVSAATTAAAAPAADDEWAWLDKLDAAQPEPAAKAETAQAQAATVNTVNEDAELEAWAQAVAAADEPAAEVPETATTPARDDISDEDWLSFDVDPVDAGTAAAAGVAVAATATAITVPEAAVADEDEWAWMEEEAEPVAARAPEPEAAVAPATETAEDDFDWLAENDNAVPVVETVAVEETTAAVEVAGDDADLLLWDETSSATEAWDIAPVEQTDVMAPAFKSTDPAEDALQRQAFAASGQDLAVVDIDWDSLDVASEPEPVADAVPAAPVATDDWLADDALAFETETVTSPAQPEPVADEADWLDAVGAETADVAPANIAEPEPVAAAPAVNLSVPLEAKLELAKMYLEIDDAQTARKTLQELVAEADGDILAEAQSLLQQLGH